MKIYRLATSLLFSSLLAGCAVNLPFNNRLNYTSIKQLAEIPKTQEAIVIKWNPNTFPQRIDVQGADSFVGSATRTRIPTGVALSNRIEEALSQFVKLTQKGTPLTITVDNARSGFEYSAATFNAPAIDVANVTFTATFEYKEEKWTKTFVSNLKDPKIGGSSQTGLLDSAWDDIAVQVAKDIANHINK
ncbi:hypothetical protein [Acinetobacter rudis]|uniref:Lipoprotein n=1 Tax=Acinetobacter rudis CIP 110305 TaxID=421052 RepID=S3MV08_9GAMM|nr:hypothetical protein [Acinetobacter rudis]EPF71595.1 hypothetical protein F945_02628 [Acinetobacter rudis CIP 110305]